MHDQKVKDLGADHFGNQHPIRGYWLVDAIERWAADQPDGRKVKASEISQEVTRYRNFHSPASHGPGKCGRIISTDPRWYKQGVWLIKGKQPIATPQGAIQKWFNTSAPTRAQAVEFARLYTAHANKQGMNGLSARAIQPHLIAAGYTIVARPNNRAIYARSDDWI